MKVVLMSGTVGSEKESTSDQIIAISTFINMTPIDPGPCCVWSLLFSAFKFSSVMLPLLYGVQ